ncbi:putative sodium-coupled neutral amino acid transporter 7 [Fopius arisanus]|uniref:Sodium-coupled neutral amino acid transporter 7 n=1 Tax=Fopius arisanus TaxID=64838 RepID=A0A9R1TAD8_9HYME|nr:PREDICTED: putative sodium-coupled neutral amino acid transporter 7 [Fopius arisanus]
MSFMSGVEPLLDNTTELTGEHPPQRSPNNGGAGILGTIFLIVNATLGAGLLNFPLAFDKSGGIFSAVIIQGIFLVFITTALIILAACSDMTNTSSMPDTLAGLCGPKALMICGICVTIYSFGCCLTFVIIIGDQFDRVLATFYGMDYCHHWFLSRNFITTVSCIIFILPLSFFKRLDVLSYASTVGCLTIIYVTWLVIYESMTTEDYPKPTQIWPKNATQALQIIPIICFAYQSHMTAIPTYACMKDRNLRKFTISSIISMSICFIVYTVVGVFGYQTFGSGKVPSDILQGYTDESITLAVAILALAVKNFTTYPIVLFCGRNSLLGLFPSDIETNPTIRVVVTLLWFVASLVLAIFVPDISPVINLLGTLSAAFIFIFPGVCLLQSVLIRDPSLYLNKNRFSTLLAIVITALGGFVAGFVFVEALDDLHKSLPEKTLVTGLRRDLGASLCA